MNKKIIKQKQKLSQNHCKLKISNGKGCFGESTVKQQIVFATLHIRSTLQIRIFSLFFTPNPDIRILSGCFFVQVSIGQRIFNLIGIGPIHCLARIAIPEFFSDPGILM